MVLKIYLILQDFLEMDLLVVYYQLLLVEHFLILFLLHPQNLQLVLHLG
jgi:hypothetical protein